MFKCLVLASLLLSSCAHTTENPALAKINVQLGLAYLDKADIAQAKSKFLQAKQQAPKDPVVWYSMAYFYECIADFKRAQTYYQKAIALNPQSGCAHNNYGTFLYRQGKYQEALAHFKLAVQDEYYLDAAKADQNAAMCKHYLKLGPAAKSSLASS